MGPDVSCLTGLQAALSIHIMESGHRICTRYQDVFLLSWYLFTARYHDSADTKTMQELVAYCKAARLYIDCWTLQKNSRQTVGWRGGGRGRVRGARAGSNDNEMRGAGMDQGEAAGSTTLVAVEQYQEAGRAWSRCKAGLLGHCWTLQKGFRYGGGVAGEGSEAGRGWR